MKFYVSFLFFIFGIFVFSQEANEEILTNELIVNELITKIITYKKHNSIEKRFKSFEYTNHSKIIFNADESLIPDKIDKIIDYNLRSFLKYKADSTAYKFKQNLKYKYFFIAEEISNIQHSDKREREIILAVKMAGFKEPVYEFMSLGVTILDYYKDYINLLGTSYVSPLAKNALKNYRFSLIDISNKDYYIHFESKKRKKSIGLKGYLTIDKKSFALTKVITNINGKINVDIAQDFIYLKEYGIWSVKKTDIILTKGTSESSVKAFRRLIGFAPKHSSSKFKPEDVSYIQISSENTSIEINKPINIKKNDYAVIINSTAINRKSPYWKKENTLQEENTYRFLDSFAKSNKIERRLIGLRKLTKGKFDSKYFDIDLSQVISFNNHEGFRLGFGGDTSNLISEIYKLTGYASYGFKDKKIKYQYGFDVRTNKNSDTWIGASYTSDLHEAAKPRLLFKEPNFALINPRNTNISLFYKYKNTELHLHHEILPNLKSKLQFSVGEYHNIFDYSFISRTKLLHDYYLTNLCFAMEWTPLSKYMLTPRGKFSVKSAFPKINIEVSKSFNNFLNGDFNYTQIHAKLNHEIKTIKSGSTQFLFKGGYIIGEAPFSHLYNHLPNHALVSPWRARINLSGTNAFETMLFNEFISDKFATIQIRQNFEKFRIGANFKPKLSFITRYAIGTIKNPQNHHGVKFKALNKGYIESGFVMNQLFYGLGFSAFYRYGPYELPEFEDNIALKITYVIALF